MTSNKYQKYNETIRLDETQKETILRNIMEADVKPARRSVPGWRFAAVFACVLALFAFLILPRHKASPDAASAAEAETESAVMYDALPTEESAEAEEADRLRAEDLSNALGYRIPDMDGYAPEARPEYEQVSDTSGRIVLTAGGSTVTILTDTGSETAVENSLTLLPAEQGAAPAADSAEEPTVSRISFEQDGIVYQVLFEPAADAEEAAKIERYIRERVQQ